MLDMNKYGHVFLLGQQLTPSGSPSFTLHLGIAVLLVFLALGVFAFFALLLRNKSGNTGSLAQHNRRSVLAVVIFAMLLLGTAFAIPPIDGVLKDQEVRRINDEKKIAQADEFAKKTADFAKTTAIINELEKRVDNLRTENQAVSAEVHRQSQVLATAELQKQLDVAYAERLRSENKRLQKETERQQQINVSLQADFNEARSNLQKTEVAIAQKDTEISRLTGSLGQYAQSRTVSRPVTESCYKPVSQFSTVTEIPTIVLPNVTPTATQGSIYLWPSTYYYPSTCP